MKPKLACNLSTAIIGLLQENRVRLGYLGLTRLDVLEQELDLALQYKPALLHIFESAGEKPQITGSYDWEYINKAIERAGSPHIGLHLQLKPEDWPAPIEIKYQDRHIARKIVEHLINNFAVVKRKLRCPVLFENVPYYGFRGTLRICVEPALMWQLVHGGIGMLLDVAHLRCTAYHLGVDVYSLASAWPLSSVREIHVSGSTIVEGKGLMDSHATLSEEDYEILDWLLERTNPEVVTLEYGGTDPEFEMMEDNVSAELEKQLKVLDGMIS
jgi:uncharacterized protein (UPF0276 family)